MVIYTEMIMNLKFAIHWEVMLGFIKFKCTITLFKI